jgi:hypothetical protein
MAFLLILLGAKFLLDLFALSYSIYGSGLVILSRWISTPPKVSHNLFMETISGLLEDNSLMNFSNFE